MPSELEQFFQVFHHPIMSPAARWVREQTTPVATACVSSTQSQRQSMPPQGALQAAAWCHSSALRGSHRQTVPYGGEVIHRSSTTVREALPTVGLIAAFSAAWYKLREEWDAERWTSTSLGCTDLKYVWCLFSSHPNSLTGKNFKIKEHFLFLLLHRGQKQTHQLWSKRCW